MKKNGGTAQTKTEGWDEIKELERELKIWELKLKIIQTKSSWIAQKQALNQTKETKEPLAPEEF